jgi:hypothetical protein
LFIVYGRGTLDAQGFDVLRRSSAQIYAELNLQDNIEIHQPNNPIQLNAAVSLTPTRTFPQIRTTPQKITKNLTIHFGIYKLPEPNGTAILPKSKRTDTTKNQPEYENELSISVSSDTPHNFPINFLAPKNEGVYEIIVSIYTQTQTPLPRSFIKPDLEITQQIVVVTPEPKQQNQTQNNSDYINFDKELIDQNITQKNEWWKPNLRRLPTIPTIPVPAIPTPRLPSFMDRNQAANIAPTNNLRFAINENLFAPFFEQNTNQATNNTEKNNSSTNTNNANIFLHPSQNLDEHSWHAVSLNLHEIGKPHLIEIDYPTSITQKLEIAVIETVDNEHIVSAESCINVTKNISVTPIELQQSNTHRILFWSKTKNPLLLFVNRTKQNCSFSNIRLYKITSDPIPRQYKIIPKRLVAGYLNRPEALLQLASTVEKTEPQPNPNNLETTKFFAQDWQTLYESANRLVDVLNWGGFDGVMLNVASSDAILYRTDSAQIESQRDMLELLHRLFDREILSLIPAINFNMRLQKIDSMIQNNPQLANELTQIDTETPPNNNNNNDTNINVTINNTETKKSRIHYNFLHPIVKETLLNTIREITIRYGTHQSFGGIGIILSHDSHVLLREPLKSLDDWTIREFAKDTGTFIPDTNYTNLRDRIEVRTKFFQNNNAALEAFINWRNIRVKEFYQEIVKTIVAVQSNARLYLAADAIFDDPDVKQFCLPSLPRTDVVLLSQRILGYDPAIICEIPSLTFLRPSRRSPDMQNESAAVYSDFDTTNICTQFARKGISFGTLFFDDSNQLTSVPVSIHNRRRFVKQLAQSDVAMFFDGGNSLLNGEDEMLRDLFATFRQLPPLVFNTFSHSPNQHQPANPTTITTASTTTTPPTPPTTTNEKSTQPITVRYANNGSGLFVYVVNDAPFEVRTDIDFKVKDGVGFYELSGRKKFETGTWRDGRQKISFRVEAYNLMAIYIDDAEAKIENVDILRPEYICGMNGVLSEWVKQLGQQIQIARGGIRWDKLSNAGFDKAIDQSKQNFQKTDLPKNILHESVKQFDSSSYEYSEYNGWQALATTGAAANIDLAVKHEGVASLKLSCVGADKNVCVSSDPFELPATGRLFVSFFVGIRRNAGQNNTTINELKMPLSFQVSVVEINGNNNETNKSINRTINRTFNMESLLKPVTGGAPTNNDANDNIRWFKVVVPFDRLPIVEGVDVVLRFSLSGMMTVWVDDITLYQVAFTPEESNELFKLLAAADVRRSENRVSDLMTLFDSYWVQFLLHNTPTKNINTSPNQTAIANIPPNNINTTPKTAMTPTPEKNTILKRVKSWIKWR